MEDIGWYCVCSQPKHEHIAAAYLRKTEDVEVFLPRIRFQRKTRQSSTWTTEALFPGYLFARFDWQRSFRQVQATSGVRSIVQFGKHTPVVPRELIEELRQSLGSTELHTIPREFNPGESVQITEGALRGLSAVVCQVMPARERIIVLMEILGQRTSVEVTIDSILKEGRVRSVLLPVG
jgi:transcriptional antiterminator RfaH